MSPESPRTFFDGYLANCFPKTPPTTEERDAFEKIFVARLELMRRALSEVMLALKELNAKEARHLSLSPQEFRLLKRAPLDFEFMPERHATGNGTITLASGRMGSAMDGESLVKIYPDFLDLKYYEMVQILAHEIKHTTQKTTYFHPLPVSFLQRYLELDAERFSIYIADQIAKKHGNRLLDDLPPDFDKKVTLRELWNDFQVLRNSNSHQMKNLGNLRHRMAGGQELPPYWWDSGMGVIAKSFDTLGLKSLSAFAANMKAAPSMVDPDMSVRKR